jgi:uncharacterized protein YPO0396
MRKIVWIGQYYELLGQFDTIDWTSLLAQSQERQRQQEKQQQRQQEKQQQQQLLQQPHSCSTVINFPWGIPVDRQRG